MSETPDRDDRSPIARLVRFCLENKLVIAMMVVGLVAWGIMVAPFDWKTLDNLPRSPVPTDAIPDIGENQQIVFTQWMGRSPEDVEDQITYPLTVSLLGIPNVKTVRSYSLFGFSSVYVIFDEKAEFYWSRSRVLEKLNSLPADTLPEGVTPTLGPDATALGQVYWYTLEGRDPDGEPAGKWDLHELRSIQDWQVRYSLLSAEGVSEVASVGGYVQEYQIDADPDAMRAHGVTLDQIFMAVRMSNADVGARTIEINKVEYVIRGLGFIEELEDIEDTVVRVTDNVPVTLGNVANVLRGPALRRGALDKDGAEAVGGVVVVRYGSNPLAAITNVKKKIKEISPGLPTKVIVDRHRSSPDEVARFAAAQGFEAYIGTELNQPEWLTWLRAHARDEWPRWVSTSQVTIVPFYDRAELIHETLGTLNIALLQEILITIIVVILGIMHLRSSGLISGALPLAVLMCFIGMKVFKVDANIVALSGIAIAIGTIVDMSIIVCENILNHLEIADPDEDRLEVVFRAAHEVGGAVLTAVLTTVVSFLPVFVMTGAEGKLFKPLAYTKTFALIASVLVALTVVPVGAHLLFARSAKPKASFLKRLSRVGLCVAGFLLGLFMGLWWVGIVLIILGAYGAFADTLGPKTRRSASWLANAVVVIIVWVLLTRNWEPLGPQAGLIRNLIFVGGIIGVLLLFFYFFRRAYSGILRVLLAHKLLFLVVPLLLVFAGISVWLGPQLLLGPLEAISPELLIDEADVVSLSDKALIEMRGKRHVWTQAALGMSPDTLRSELNDAGVERIDDIEAAWIETRQDIMLRDRTWGEAESANPQHVRNMPLGHRIRWSVLKSWNGLGKEFMPPLDEGSFLYMPTTMPHASIGEALDILQKQDMAFSAIPEIESVVGKIGRADTPLDPAPVSMIETVINYKSEYITDASGQRVKFRFNTHMNEFERGAMNELIPDPHGRPYRQWRDHIRSPDDIWKEILKAGRIPGATSAPRLQPIAARIVMLQSGMRAPMGVKVKGPDLESIEKVALDIERLLKGVPSVEPDAVIADRMVGKPYLEIDIDRKAIARHGMSIRKVQDVIEVAIGGKRITTTVEGRERYPVRVRYLRELRDRIETLGSVLVAGKGGEQVPLEQLSEIRYVRGPQAIKSEDTFLVGYVLFDKKPGFAEVDVVEECDRYLKSATASGKLSLPAGVSYTFAGSYENQVRSQKTLVIILPVALFIIFMILYFQFRAVSTTLLVFSGIFVAWAGGFILVWFYGQPWFMDFAVFGVNMRDLFQIHPINLSVAVWVGFLALFGIASDDGVVIATYLDQSFKGRAPDSIAAIREATIAGAARRIRPCLMTSATTILALLAVLTSTGRGSDVMVPMAIPSFGGMLVVLVTVFTVPVLYCLIKEVQFKVKNVRIRY